MDGGMSLERVSADRGGIAAGRDVHVDCTLDICPRCETRLTRRGQGICRGCARAARLARIQRDGALALLGYGVCVTIGLWLADCVGYSDRWTFGVAAAVLIFGGGYYLWLKVLAWAQSGVKRQWRECLRVLRHPRRRRLTDMVCGVPMLLWRAIATPSRRAPGSDEETHMEPNAEDAARVAKLVAEASKLLAESARINAQARWFPVLVTGTLFGAAVIVVRFLI